MLTWLLYKAFCLVKTASPPNELAERVLCFIFFAMWPLLVWQGGFDSLCRSVNLARRSWLSWRNTTNQITLSIVQYARKAKRLSRNLLSQHAPSLQPIIWLNCSPVSLSSRWKKVQVAELQWRTWCHGMPAMPGEIMKGHTGQTEANFRMEKSTRLIDTCLPDMELCCQSRVSQRNYFRMHIPRSEGPASSCTSCKKESDSFPSSNWMITILVRTCHSDGLHSNWRFATLSCQSWWFNRKQVKTSGHFQSSKPSPCSPCKPHLELSQQLWLETADRQICWFVPMWLHIVY